MQFINTVLLIVAAAIYQTASPVSSLDSSYTAWMTFVAFFVPTAAIYTGYWLLNDNFLAYYVIEEIINALDPNGSTDVALLGMTTTPQA